MDPVDRRDELIVTVPPTVLLAFSPLIAVLRLVLGFGLSLTLVFAKDCTNGLLVGGVACHEVEQLLHHSCFAASELMNKCFICHARDERFDHVYIHDIGKLVVLLRKATDVLM
jgi:hypothetical protein